MKASGILHPRLAALVAGLGHGQLITVADAGLPIGATTERIDLAVQCGVPSFRDVLAVIAQELAVERVIVAREAGTGGPLEAALVEAFGERLPPREIVDHEQLKALADHSVAVVRTGECTPYMNVVLVAGVTF